MREHKKKIKKKKRRKKRKMKTKERESRKTKTFISFAENGEKIFFFLRSIECAPHYLLSFFVLGKTIKILIIVTIKIPLEETIMVKFFGE